MLGFGWVLFCLMILFLAVKERLGEKKQLWPVHPNQIARVSIFHLYLCLHLYLYLHLCLYLYFCICICICTGKEDTVSPIHPNPIACVSKLHRCTSGESEYAATLTLLLLRLSNLQNSQYSALFCSISKASKCFSQRYQ